MAKLTCTGVLGLDGTYDLALPDYTGDEWHEIKKRTGLRLGEFGDAWEALDPDAVMSIAWVSMSRAGINSRLIWEELGKAKLSEVITLDFSEDAEDTDGVDAGPPEVEQQPAVERDNVLTLTASSQSSEPLSEPSQESDQPATGTSA